MSYPSTIRCCAHCVPPERHPGCHGRCEKYLAEKEEHEKKRVAYIEAEKKRNAADKYERDTAKRLKKQAQRLHYR